MQKPLQVPPPQPVCADKHGKTILIFDHTVIEHIIIFFTLIPDTFVTIALASPSQENADKTVVALQKWPMACL